MKLITRLTGKSQSTEQITADQMRAIAEPFHLWESGRKQLNEMTDSELIFFSEYLRMRLSVSSVSANVYSSNPKKFPWKKFFSLIPILFFAWILIHFVS